MNWLYNLLAHLTYFFLQISGLFNRKMQQFIQGRAETSKKLAGISKEDRVVWFHAASLGEFEQARPIIEEVHKQYANHKIVVSFFSPSGYEIRKNYELADVVCYLPFDTKRRVRRFIDQIHPDLAIIVKYEFWPNLLNQLKKKSVPTILVSGIFRDNQAFFKSYGKWMQRSLQAFDSFFVQNSHSEDLLKSIGFHNVEITGDTRFDRVSKILNQDNRLDFMDDFKRDQYLLVAGSTWEEDEQLLVNYINQSSQEKFVIAPHNMDPKTIQKLKTTIQRKTALYSERETVVLSDCEVLIVDTIGLLTKIYAYADSVYVGGAFRTGLHNILEPATFGVPIVIGPHFSKFQEAVDLVALKGCYTVKDQAQFSSIFEQLNKDEKFRQKAGAINHEYIESNKGATAKIMYYINQKLKP